MYNETKTGLENAQTRVINTRKNLRDTNRIALRSYLKAAFDLQRAGLEAVEALQKGAEELTFNLLDRTESAQDRALGGAERRLQDRVETLREARERAMATLRDNRERLQERLRDSRSDMGEAGEMTEGRLRDSVEIAGKVARVVETRVETMLSELWEMGRREMGAIEERIDALVSRLDEELEEQIHPIANYDERNVEEVLAALNGLDEMQLRTVRAYEVTRKNRVTVLRAIDERLAQTDGLGAMVAREQTMVERVETTVGEVREQGEALVERAEKAARPRRMPIANYDELNAEEIAAALPGLDARQLGTVRAYELANRNRVTVLRAIDEQVALRNDERNGKLAEPVAGYDEMNVEEVLAALDGMDARQLGTVRAYEMATKSRVTLLRAIDERLAATVMA